MFLTSPSFSIVTERLLIRPLCVDDVSVRYLSWLFDSEAKQWIKAAGTTMELSALCDYVEQRVCRSDIWFLGIFDKRSGLHIGNIKFEPIIFELKAAVMGVLIGDPAYRGIGVFSEIFPPIVKNLHSVLGVDSIYLGVSPDNFLAVAAYRSVGFEYSNVSDEYRSLLGDVRMVYRAG